MAWIAWSPVRKPRDLLLQPDPSRPGGLLQLCRQFSEWQRQKLNTISLFLAAKGALRNHLHWVLQSPKCGRYCPECKWKCDFRTARWQPAFPQQTQKGQGHSQDEARRAGSPAVLGKPEGKQITTPWSRSSMAITRCAVLPRALGWQKFAWRGLLESHPPLVNGVPLIHELLYTNFALEPQWARSLFYHGFLLGQQKPTRSKWTIGHKLWFTFQPVPLEIHLFSTHFLFPMVFSRITSAFKEGLHSVTNIFLTKTGCSFLQALLFGY